MKKDKVVKLTLYFAVILWMAVIFSFSAQDGSASLESSDGVMYALLESFDSLLGSLPVERLSFYVRKCAHFFAYFVLGVLTSCALSQSLCARRAVVSSLGVCVFYAATDELHQYFVPGRACRLFDVGVDSLGALCGILAVCAVRSLVRRVKHR